ncbi:heavy metal-binding domain-containing protein [Lutibacter citreus]|uniref:heavy metal-binding domain-containing protein n=1 Tax=Lutibacter citreus TaxID=2138210 RepID=UPI0015CFB3A9|nr:heavy metal-binding domain-containing protein [Lutibacter citreus]
MKKIIFVLTLVLSVSLMFTSCKDSKKGEMNHENHDHSKEGSSAELAYQCPMDCEKGKIYAEKGSCPVCKMDLKEKSSKKEAKHADNCKCIDGGDCKCEPGECVCEKEVAKMQKECSHCEPGSCECKA